MAINLTKPTIPAPLQSHLKVFLPLLSKETLIEVVLGLDGELTAAKQDLALERAAVAYHKQDTEALTQALTETCLSRDAARSELAAMTAEFEEKYYGLQNENRALTKRLREAEAALGVPFNDEWDSWADEANSRREIDRSINQLLLTKTLD